MTPGAVHTALDLEEGLAYLDSRVGLGVSRDAVDGTGW
jgi:hypothetical protein